MSKGSISPLFNAPKPKPKGKKPKPSKLGGGPKIKPLDVFHTALNADAGTDSSHDANTFKAFINGLSGPQLEKLDRQVQKILQRTLTPHHTKTCQRFSDALRERRARAIKKELTLREKVQARLEKLKPKHIQHTSKGQIQSLYIKEKAFPINTFIAKFLQPELALTTTLFAEGALLSRRKGQKPLSYL
ncbi:MAG: hypothetical protein KDK65_05140, partial [Chlamydiia bacterium]|nr:hypothetical protein [Chlamydiia bacterium]